MSATVTLTTTAASSPHSLCLFSPPLPADRDHHRTQQQQQQQQQLTPAPPSLSSPSPSTPSTHSSTSTSTSSSSRAGSFTDTWPMAVEALAQRLWECGREALLSRRSSNSGCDNSVSHEPKLIFGEAGGEAADVCLGVAAEEAAGGLCDGPYVRIDYSGAAQFPPASSSSSSSSSPSPLSPAPPLSALSSPTTDFADQLSPLLSSSSPPPPLQQHMACGRPPLIHYQPRTNPFKTMMRMPVTYVASKADNNSKPQLSSSSSSPVVVMAGAAAPSRACRRVEEEEEAKAATTPPSPLLALTLAASTASNNSSSNSNNKNSPPLLPHAAPPSALSSCTHCKRGNFLEFCFVDDCCSCRCHNDCPCNPCLDIKDFRQSILGAHHHHRHNNNNNRHHHYRDMSSRNLPRKSNKKAARVWVDDGHPPQLQHRQPSLCSLTT